MPMNHLKQNTVYDVFLSHSSRNKTIANALCHYLEENKIRCWMAPRDILPGKEYGEVIDQAISGAKVFVLIYSSDSQNSVWVKKETNLALSDGKTIIPFRIEACPLKGSMRTYLNDVHWIDAIPHPEQAFGHLAEAILANLEVVPPWPDGEKPQESAANPYPGDRINHASAGQGPGTGSGDRTTRNAGGQRGADLKYTLKLSLCEAVSGVNKSIRYSCPVTSNQGRDSERRELQIAVPPGVDTGALLRAAGKGESGINGGEPGDLYVEIHVLPDPVFTREGLDIRCDAVVDAATAASGGTVEIPTLAGKSLIRIPQATRHGTVFRLKGRGVPALKGDQRGDQLVRIVVKPHSGSPAVSSASARTTPEKPQESAVELFRKAEECEAHCEYDLFIRYCSEAADMGYADAQYKLGWIYQLGFPVSKDINKAVEFYKKAAAQGNAKAQRQLGACYDSGDGVRKDHQQAIYLYKLAAEQGDADAQFFLGLEYELGTMPDRRKAVEYYKKAAEQGLPDARECLRRMTNYHGEPREPHMHPRPSGRPLDGRDDSVDAACRGEVPKVGRNDPCPCGSGKRYKNCCGKG